jgi:hypothetical protein
MITEVDLEKLKYQVITRTKDNDNSLELIHQDFDERNYLVKLRKGEVHIIYPQIMQITRRPCFKTNNLDELIAWHNHY